MFQRCAVLDLWDFRDVFNVVVAYVLVFCWRDFADVFQCMLGRYFRDTCSWYIGDALMEVVERCRLVGCVFVLRWRAFSVKCVLAVMLVTLMAAVLRQCVGGAAP